MVPRSFGKKIKIDKIVVKNKNLIFYQIYGFSAMTFQIEMFERQSKTQKTRILA